MACTILLLNNNSKYERKRIQDILKLKCQKAFPDRGIIKSLMDRTLSDRRRMLVEEGADVGSHMIGGFLSVSILLESSECVWQQK